MTSPERELFRARRVLARTVVVVVAVLGSLAVLLPSSSAAEIGPNATSTSQAVTGADPSYVRVRDIDSYVQAFESYGGVVVHIDTEHMTDDGFWFASKGNDGGPPNGRQFTWIYQPWGMKCRASAADLVFNPFTNIYTCMVNVTRADTETGQQYEFVAQTPGCRAQRPWSIGLRDPGGNISCRQTGIAALRATTALAPWEAFTCAPWEPLPPFTAFSECATRYRYPWEGTTETLPWTPEPDACTGAPAGLNRYVPLDYFYDGNPTIAPACDGSDPAPNCTAATASHPACGGPVGYGLTTGWPDGNGSGGGSGDGVTESVTVTAYGDPYTASETRSQTATASAQRGVRRARVEKQVDGRTFVGKGSAPVINRARATQTRTAKSTYNAFARTATRSCTRPTQAEAVQCATDLATAAARAASSEFARVNAVQTAASMAESDALQAAREAAEAAATNGPISAEATRAAKAAALKRAKADLRRKIAQAT